MTTAIIEKTATAIQPSNKREYYQSLTPEEVTFSQETGKKFFAGARKTSEGIKEAGLALIEAKERFKGKFMLFCEFELPQKMSHDSIERLMRSAKMLQANPTLAKFNPTIIFEISKQSTPPEVVEEMQLLAESDQPIPIGVKEVQQKIRTAKNKTPEGYIKKGDLVEMQYPVKGWSYGRIVSKSTDGIVCKIQSITGESLGEKPTKSLRLCPVQKINPSSVNENIELNQRVIIKPYTTELQPLNGSEGKVIFRDEKRRQFSVQIGDMVKDFHWEEIELIPDATEVIVEVQAVEITETETLPNINLKGMGRKQKNQLLKELLKDLQLGSSLASESELEAVNDLVNATLQKMEDLEMEDLAFSSSLREQFVVIFLDKCL